MAKIRVIALWAFVLFIAFHLSDEKCCGRGKHGFCNDCAKVGLFRKQKCCHAKGNKNSCNIFCCNCAKCATGNAKTTHKSGWWFVKKYDCSLNNYGDKILENDFDASQIFNAFDSNKDKVLDVEEFADAALSHLTMDKEAALGFSSQLLQTEDSQDVIKFVEDVARDEERADGARLLANEFISMDINADGKIQANEFDRDLD